MSDLRHDPIQKRWVIIATERVRRPQDFHAKEEPRKMSFCPFCPGNEHATPPEIMSVKNEHGWKIRVVPNKFPALRIEGETGRQGVGLFDKMNGIGAHEVVIDSPSHETSLAYFSVDDIVDLMRVWQERIRDLCKDTRFRYILLFKNHGDAAGASLAHPHCQIIATPITPRTVSMELQSCKDYFFVKERCLICDIIAQELDQKARIVSVGERFVVFAPFAARFPFETCIAPRIHQHDFLRTTAEELHLFAVALKDTLLRLSVGLDDPPYNFMLHNSPNIQWHPHRPGYWTTLEHDYHWHLEIIPRVTKMAGFEWGTGFYINPTAPEDAAKYLREVEV